MDFCSSIFYNLLFLYSHSFIYLSCSNCSKIDTWEPLRVGAYILLSQAHNFDCFFTFWSYPFGTGRPNFTYFTFLRPEIGFFFFFFKEPWIVLKNQGLDTKSCLCTYSVMSLYWQFTFRFHIFFPVLISCF